MNGTCTVRKANRWYVLQYGGLDPATGKKRYKWTSGFASKREADEFRRTLASHPLFSAGQGIYGTTRLRTGDFLKDYIGELETKKIVRAKTADTYRMFAKVYIGPELGHVPLVRLSPQGIEKFQGRLLDAGKSMTTVHHTLQFLSQALAKAVRQGLIARNPIESVDVVKRDRRERDVWNLEQVLAFLDEARRTPYYLIYELALTSGMRQSEIFGVRWQDIDLTSGTLQVRQILVRPGRNPVFGPPKTRKSRRPVLLPVEMAAELRSWHTRQAAERLKAGAQWQDYDLVFAARDGKPLHPHNVCRRDFHKVIERAKLPQITFHDLRHIHVTELVVSGVDVRTVADRVGHTRTSMTLDTYTHSVPARQEQAAAASSKFLVPEKVPERVLQ